MDDISLKVRVKALLSCSILNNLKVYDALAFHVAQNNINGRLKSVSLWSLQVTAATVISMIRNILDPAATQIRDIYLSEDGGY